MLTIRHCGLCVCRQPFYFAHHHLGGLSERDRIPSPQSPVRKKPVVKKPLNAFMLFMKEQRPKVIEEESIKESAAINQILGRRVSTIDFSNLL